MKIAILTLPLHTNYGGILQAYALQTVLERMGHEVKVLNRDRSMRIAKWSYPIIIAKRIASKYILGHYRGEILIEHTFNKKLATIEQHTRRFSHRYIHNHYYCTLEDLGGFNTDAIVVGSDQIWNHIYAKNVCGSVVNAYLPFTTGKEMKRITYAASFGKDVWEYTTEETAKCRELVKQFDAISVREETGVKLSNEHLGVEAQCHLDPTLLLDADDYVRYLSIGAVPQSKGNLLLYIIDKDEKKMQVAESIANSKHLTPFEVNSRAEDTSTIHYCIEECIQPPVEQWLRGFYDAKYVVTDSFHACVFSIIFQKPFIVVGNKARGLARFESLLSKFNLTSRLVESVAQVDDELLNTPINWNDVQERLATLRIESMNYLKKYL